MGSGQQALPQWTWEDLEAALEAFTPSGAGDPVRAHLLRGLRADSLSASPRELLQQVLSAGWVMAQVGAQSTRMPDASVTARRPAVGASA